MRDFKIWYDAVTSYLRSKGVTEWCEGEIGGGYAIWGSPEVEKEIANFNKQYLKASIRHNVLPNFSEDNSPRLNLTGKKLEHINKKD